MSDDIRRRMFNEMEQKFLFDEARNAAYSLRRQGALDRNMFPRAGKRSSNLTAIR